MTVIVNVVDMTLGHTPTRYTNDCEWNLCLDTTDDPFMNSLQGKLLIKVGSTKDMKTHLISTHTNRYFDQPIP